MSKRTAYTGGVTKSQHQFAQIPKADIQRSQFNRSHGLKTSYDAGLLIPIFVDEALPGDTLSMRVSSFARLATPIFPVMDNMWMDFFWFSVSNRILWENWVKFCGEQTDPGDPINYTVPVVTAHTPAIGSLADYFGLPTDGGNVEYNALHSRAYNMIFREWFRDENLVDSPVVDVDDGPDANADYVIRRRGKRHDYFTSCLPWTQKGDAVTLPLGTTAPVIPNTIASSYPLFKVGTTDANRLMANAVGGDNVHMLNPVTGDTQLYWDGHQSTGLIANLAGATAATINEMREAFQIQRLLERDARGGSRYTEIVKSHFGVTSPDSRLQRPEYLGGGSTRISIHPVQATAGDSTVGDDPPLGTLAGFGTAAQDGIGFTKSFTEHSVIIGLVNVRAELTYQQGLNRMWSRQTRYDFYWPALAQLGEQPVFNKEIYYDSGGTPDDVFGYQERYAEYRYKPSYTTALMRSQAAGTLHFWHLGLDFASQPELNETFIEDDPPIDRIIVTPSEPHFIADFYFNYKCARPMPTYSVPGMIDHF